MKIGKDSGNDGHEVRQPKRSLITQSRVSAQTVVDSWGFGAQRHQYRGDEEGRLQESDIKKRSGVDPSDPGRLQLVLLSGAHKSWEEIEAAVSKRPWRFRVFKDLTALGDILASAPKVMLVDAVFMPELGFLSQWLSMQHGDKPVLYVISEYCGTKLHLQAISLGASKLFVEPIDTNSLIKTVEESLWPKTAHVYRLLVIEGEMASAKVMAESLPLAVFETKFLQDPLSVIDAIWSFRPDGILLSDRHMMQVHPMVLTKLIREREESHAIPIVILSDKDDQETRLSCLQAGADDFLVASKQSQYLGQSIICRIERARAISNAGVISQHDHAVSLPDKRAMLSRLEQVSDDIKDGGWAHGLIAIALDHRMGGQIHQDSERAEREVLSLAEGLRPILQSRDCLARLGCGQVAILICRASNREVSRIVDLVSEIMRYRINQQTHGQTDYGIDVKMLVDGVGSLEALLDQGMRAAGDACKRNLYRIKVYGRPQRSSVRRVKDGVDWDKAGFLRSLDSNPPALAENSYECVSRWASGIETIELVPHCIGLNEPVDLYRQAALCGSAAEFDLLVCEIAIQHLYEYTLQGKSVRFILRQSDSALQDCGYIDSIKQVLRKLHIVGNGLYLEFSLSSIASNLRRASSFFAELRALGIGISLSHFPYADSGFRALKYLQAAIIRPRASLLHQTTEGIEGIARRVHSMNAEIVLPYIDYNEGIVMEWEDHSDYIEYNLLLEMRKQRQSRQCSIISYSRDADSHLIL